MIGVTMIDKTPENAKNLYPEAPHKSGENVINKIRQVGKDLSITLRRVLEALPDKPHRPGELARKLGLNRDISGRVLKAISKKDPLSVTHIIPGPEPLRSLLRAAAKRKVTDTIIARAESAIQQFDQLIRNEAGTRSALDAIISSTEPKTREKFEVASRHSVFKGMNQLKGIQAETWLSTTLIHPSAEDPAHHDIALIHGALQIQRLRPGVTVKFTYRELIEEDEKEPGSNNSTELGTLPLNHFFTNPPARLESYRTGKVNVYTLADDHLGPSSVVDMLVLDHHPGALERYDSSDPVNKKGTFVSPDIPVKTLIFDTLLHEDAYPGSDPDLAVYDMGVEGAASVNNPTRDADRVDMHTPVEFLGKGTHRFYAQEIPNYPDMLHYVCKQYGWDNNCFRGYRCRIQYPVHGWQVCMSFTPPPIVLK